MGWTIAALLGWLVWVLWSLFLMFVGWVMVRVWLLSLGLGLSIVLLGAGGAFGEQKRAVVGTVQVDEAEGKRLLKLAEDLREAKEYNKAIEAAQKALVYYERIQNYQVSAWILVQISQLYGRQVQELYDQRQYAQANQVSQQSINAAEQSVEAAKKTSSKSIQANSLLELSNRYRTHAQIANLAGNYERSLSIGLKGIQISSEALALYRELKDSKYINFSLYIMAGYFVGLAQNYDNLKRYELALDAVRKARQLYIESGDDKEAKSQINLEISIYHSISLAASSNEELTKKIEANQKIIQLAFEIDNLDKELMAKSNIANAYRDLGQIDEAIKYYQEVILRSNNENTKDYKYNALISVGFIQQNRGRYDEAISYYTKALESLEMISRLSGESQALGLMASVYASRGQYRLATQSYENVLKSHQARYSIYKQGVNQASIVTLCQASNSFKRKRQEVGSSLEWQCQNPKIPPTGDLLNKISALISGSAILERSMESTTLNNMGNVYQAQGDYLKALNFFQASNQINQELKEDVAEPGCVTLGNIASIYLSLGESKKSLELGQNAFRCASQLKNHARIMEAHMVLGRIYSFTGKSSEALNEYQKSQDIAKKIERPFDQAYAMSNLGGFYSNQGDYVNALDSLTQALEIFERIGEPYSEVDTLYAISEVYQRFGQHDKALELENKALKISQIIGTQALTAKILMKIAETYRDKQDFEKSKQYYEQSLSIADSINELRWSSKTRAGLGQLFLQQNNPELALDNIQKALATQERIGAKRDVVETLRIFGQAQTQLNQPEAQTTLQNAIALAQEVGDRPTKAKALGNLGDLLVRKNQPELAIAFYKESVNIYESIRNNLRSLSRETQESYTSSIAKTYRNLADLLLTQGRTREAQEILELLKVQETRNYDRASQSQQPTVQLTLHPLEQQALQTFETALAKPPKRGIARKQLLTLQDYEKLNQTLRQNRDRLIKDGNAKESTIGNPKNLITNPNTLLIQNLVVNNKIWVIWTSQSGQTKAIATPVPQTDLDQTVEQFRQQLSSPTSSLPSLQSTSRKLHNWLIPPALQTELTQHPKQHLIFSLDHVTRYIPVATLHDGQTYLAQRHQLSNVITTQTDTTDRLPPPAQTPVLALGTAKEFPNFSELKFVPIELQSISQDGNPQGLYPGQKYLNAGFNRDVLKRLDRYRIVHIATHGQFNPTNILNSFLLLGNGDRLPISEIDQLTNLTNTHLVVLSACQTGLGEVKSDGTEISGMSGYFLYRGAKSVMASLWSVSDPSTALSMRQFYRGLAQGQTKAEALQQVQRDFIQGKLTSTDADKLRASMGEEPILVRPNYQHPFYWAPFILVGNSL